MMAKYIFYFKKIKKKVNYNNTFFIKIIIKKYINGLLENIRKLT